MGSKKKVKKLKKEHVDDEEKEIDSKEATLEPVEDAREHKGQLERLSEKDPEFYAFLKEHDNELLEFDAEEDAGTDMDDEATPDGEDNVVDALDHTDASAKKKEEPSIKDITSEMVDSWCKAIKEGRRIGAIRSIMRAFRTVTHSSDNGDEGKLNIASSHKSYKILTFVFTEMDGVFRDLMKLPSDGGKKEMILDLMHTRAWKNYNHLVKAYLGNALHYLNQATETSWIEYLLKRLRRSCVFLAAFPTLLRKYIKAVLHYWGSGEVVLTFLSFRFLRDLCVQLGSDCVDECFKGIYKAYVLNCHFVNPTKLQHIQLLGDCVRELYMVDLPSAYQHAFVFIRQLAMILREALATKRKDVSRKVYEWKYMNCLQLWTGCICAFGKEADFKPLTYPLTQIISGVARLVPTARYLPLRLRCIRMLNLIAASTNTFIPVALLLLDMLEMKELHRPPTGGVGKAVDLRTVLRVSKATVKTRSFQEACVFSVVEELAEHLAQWSYSPAFSELSFVPVVRLRNFCKSTKVERFRREMRELIRQIEANSEFINGKRMSISCLPNDTAATSFLEDEKEKGASPLSKYVATLHQRAQQRNGSLAESSVIVGERSFAFGNKIAGIDEDEDEEDDKANEEVAPDFSSSWLPTGNHKTRQLEEKTDRKGKQQKKKGPKKNVAEDEDVVEDLVLSSDEEDSMSDGSPSETEDVEAEAKQQKHSKKPSSKRKGKFQAKKSKKRKRAH